MSRHVFGVRATDKNGTAISGTTFTAYPYQSGATWFSRVDGEWQIDTEAAPTPASFYATDDETDDTLAGDIVSGSDGFPVVVGYLDTGIYTVVGEVDTVSGTRVFIDAKYELGIYEAPPFEGVVRFEYPDGWSLRPRGLRIQKTGERWLADIEDYVHRFFPVEVFDSDDPNDECWVGFGGSGSSTGTRADPFLTMTQAFAAQKSRIYMMPGDYYRIWPTGIEPLIPVSVEAPYGRARFISGIQTTTLTWADIGAGVWRADPEYDLVTLNTELFEQKYIDKNGLFKRLEKVTTLIECQALPGSWVALDVDTLYVHTEDDREPDDDILICAHYQCPQQTSAISASYKNVSFIGGAAGAFDSRPGADSSLFYAEGCEFLCSNDRGGYRGLGANSILNNCIAALNATDQFSYHDFNSNPCFAIEIDCVAFVPDHAGIATEDINSNNASTCHDTGSIIRIGGNSVGQRGPVLVDANSSSSLNIGVQSISLDEYAAFKQFGDGTAYVIDCRLEGETALEQLDTVVMYKDEYTRLKGAIIGEVLDL